MSANPLNNTAIDVDDDVAFIAEQLQRLKELGLRDDAHDSNVFNDEDVYDLSVRWGTALAGRLPRIAHYSANGSLADADECRFQSLCDELRALSPLIEKFRLTRPDLADYPDAHEKGRRQRKNRKTKGRSFPRS
jgi:hypothetical protein